MVAGYSDWFKKHYPERWLRLLNSQRNRPDVISLVRQR
jgi:hypothetical protein